MYRTLRIACWPLSMSLFVAAGLPSTVAWAAPGSCLLDTRTDAAARVKDAGRLDRRDFVDLDGDGQSETVWVPTDLCGASGNCTELLYLSGNGCSTFAGELGGVDMQVLPSSTNGAADLWAFWRSGCAGAAGTAALFRYDGYQYDQFALIECPCPVDGAAMPVACAPRDDASASTLAEVSSWLFGRGRQELPGDLENPPPDLDVAYPRLDGTPLAPIRRPQAGAGPEASSVRQAFGSSWVEVTIGRQAVRVEAGGGNGRPAAVELERPPGRLVPDVAFGEPMRCGDEVFLALEIHRGWPEGGGGQRGSDLLVVAVPALADRGAARIAASLPGRGGATSEGGGWGHDVVVGEDCSLALERRTATWPMAPVSGDDREA